MPGHASRHIHTSISRRQIGFSEIGTPDVLREFRDDQYIITDDAVVVQTEFVGVNMGDVIRRKRGGVQLSAKDPFIPGFDGVGIVTHAPKSHQHWLNQRVAFLTPQGGYTSHLITTPKHVALLPADIDAQQIASIICSGITATLIVSKIRPTQSVLVYGAAGGVGRQVLRLLFGQQIHTTAVVSTAAKADEIRAICHHAIVSPSGELPQALSCDVIVDGVGAQAQQGVNHINPQGSWIVFGSASGSSNFVNTEILKKRITIIGLLVFDILTDDGTFHKHLHQLCDYVRNHVLQPQYQVIRPDQIASIHEQFENRQMMNRVIMDTRNWSNT